MIIDINSDLGEGMGNDGLIMPYITSCNIACGGHYGDKASILATINQAQKHQLKIGAHPSFPDKLNFGRKVINISEKGLYDSLCKQIYLFSECCKQLDITFHHVKLHGALYNLAAKDNQTAQVVIKALNTCCKGTVLYVPYKSELAKLAQSDFKIFYEAFADRNYHSNLALVSRDKADAVITDPKIAWQQMAYMIENQQVKTIEGQYVDIKADTYCIHGDQPHALELVKYIAKKLNNYQLT
jgi:UPF0271 protein